MEFKAFKMDGLGNDFVIIDNRSNNVELNKDQIIKICDRNFIGCDQLVYINNSDNADADLEFYNSDGSAADACGNGTRCVAFLLSKEKNTKKRKSSSHCFNKKNGRRFKPIFIRKGYQCQISSFGY